MKKLLKRCAALVLTLCLLTTMLSTIVSAESEQPADPSVLTQQFTERVKSLQTLSVKMEDLPQERIASANSGAVSYSTRAISNSNYNTLRNFINTYGLVDDNGNKVYLETIEDSGYLHYFALTNLSSGIQFRLFTKSSDSVRVDCSVEFTLTNSSNYISIIGSAVCYYYNSAEDFVAQTITYDQRNYTDSTTLPFTQSSMYGYITASDFRMLMSNGMSLLCKYWDVTIYGYLGFGLVDLGFTNYDGLSSSCTNHIYDNACDATCNNCGATRTVTHTYDSSCDTTCNWCGATRTTGYSHSYSSNCDAACDYCWAIRTPVSNHTFNGNVVCSRCYAMFSDVSTTSWQIDYVVYVYDKGLMAGKGSDQYGDVKFDPNSRLTREEFVQVLYNAEGRPSANIPNRFPDVKNDWYKNAVLWANKAQVVMGMGNGKFGVGMKITRQDLAVMLYRYAQMKGYSLDAETGKIDGFADGNKVSDYAKEAMNWAVTNKILNGKGDAGADISTMRLDPLGNATRAECAAMLKNFMTAFEGYTPPSLDGATVTMYMPDSTDGYDPNECYVNEVVAETLGCDLNVIELDSFANQYLTMLAEGDVPDLTWMNAYTQMYTQLGYDGAYINIYDYLDLMPNVKVFIEDPENAEDIAKYTVEEGVMFALPVHCQEITDPYAFLYRKDIFDKHNLTFPTTQDEFVATLRKLKELYPGSYPFVMRQMSGNMKSIQAFGHLWGSSHVTQSNFSTIFTLDENGNYYMAQQSLAYKEMAQFLNELTVEGLMHPSCVTMDTAGWMEAFASDTSFITYDKTDRLNPINRTGQSLQEDFLMVAGAPFNFGTYAKKTNVVSTSWADGIGAGSSYCYMIGNNRNLESTLMYIDWLYSEEGQVLTNWGVEGESWEWANKAAGTRKYIDGFFDEVEDRISSGLSAAALVGVIDYESYTASLTESDKDSLEMAQQFLGKSPAQHQLRFTEEEQLIYDTYATACYNYAQSQWSKFYLGMRDFSEWDQVINEMRKKYHYDDLMEIHETALARLKAQQGI